MNFWRVFLLLSYLILSPLAFANGDSLQGLDQVYIDFIIAEQSNDYQAKDSTVDERYRAKDLKPFRVGYLEIPENRLNVEISQSHPELLNTHFFTHKNGQRFVRFYIHPDSEHLYRPLIKEFGYKGYYLALPTASTRTVLAWRPNEPQLKPVFLKLSLAQKQDRLGRIVPAWEVRRSVRVTEMIDSDLREGRIPREAPVQVIPEIAGASIQSSEGISYFVDISQGHVSEHGYILRDASFIEKYRGKIVVPMFWLFTKLNGFEPMIIQLWKMSADYTTDPKKQGIAFSRFLETQFIRPFIRQNLPLMLKQGIVPQIHGQNVILVINPGTGELEATLHRDIGSMKTDYRLRWIHGLPISNLRSANPDKDFGLSWGAEKIEEYHRSYLHDWIFRWAYLNNMKEHVAKFNLGTTHLMVRRVLREEVLSLLRAKKTEGTATEKILEYINRNPPKIEAKQSRLPDANIQSFLVKSEKEGRSVPLPKAWQKTLSGYVSTAYGVVYSRRSIGLSGDTLRIAFYSDFKESRVACRSLRFH